MDIEDVKAVFTPFADPATTVGIDQTESGTRVQLVRDGARKTYYVEASTGLVQARDSDGREYISLDSLLASEEFSDLRNLASTQLRLLTDEAQSLYIEPNLSMVGVVGEDTSIDQLRNTLGLPTSGKTRILLLDGPAGIGKTRLLQRLTWAQAKSHLQGRSDAPILYVGSRGARLSNLRAELAATTQHLRARITYDQVPVLVKRGLLHLAIDGFDELVDADGYQDAWYALRDFLGELRESGVCILAGRDTFFDQQGFFDRLKSANAQVELIQAHLAPVSPERARQWLRDYGWPEEEVTAPESECVFQPDSYSLRPYFLSVLAEAKGWDSVTREASARAFLISRFLDREAKLVEEMVNVKRSAARQAIEKMFEEAAMDMAERESTEVDLEYLTFLCEIAFDSLLPPDDLRKLQHKAGSFALLERGSTARVRRFPHSEIQHHFLVRSVIAELGNHSIPLVLRRGVLGADFMEMFQEYIEREDPDILSNALYYLEVVLRQEITTDRLPYNGAGILLAALTRSLPSDPRQLENLAVNECSWADQLAEARLRNVTIYRLEARGADLSHVQFSDCHVSILVADTTTTFGTSAPAITAIHQVERGYSTTLRATEDIQAWVAQHTVTEGDDDDAMPLVRFFDRVCRKALRQFYFRQGGDDPAASLLNHHFWPEIRAILEEEKRIETRNIEAGGPAAVFLHIKGAQNLISPPHTDADAGRIRTRVIERARELEAAAGGGTA